MQVGQVGGLQRHTISGQRRPQQGAGFIGAEVAAHADLGLFFPPAVLPHTFAKVGVAQAAVCGQIGGHLRNTLRLQIQRPGSLTIWRDKNMQWYAPASGKRGCQHILADAAIQFGLALRQSLGLVESLLRMASLDWRVSDCSTVCRYQKTLRVPLLYRASTSALEIRAIEVTGSSVGAAPMLPELLGQIPQGEAIASVSADGMGVTVTDEKGGVANVTIADVYQSKMGACLRCKLAPTLRDRRYRCMSSRILKKLAKRGTPLGFTSRNR